MAVQPAHSPQPTETTTGLQFRLRYPDGRSEQLVVDADRALLGSAAHCEVRLPPEYALPEAVEVFSSDNTVHLAARPGQNPPLLDNVPVLSGPWGPGQVLTLGAVSLTVKIVDLGQKRRGGSPFWLLAIAPIIAILAVVVIGTRFGPPELELPTAPPLFDPPLTNCPPTPPDLVAAFATEKLRLAVSKRERGPFSSSDAVAAVPLFEVAAACYKVAGDPESERDTLAAATTLRKKLEEEYNVRRVRLAHYYKIGDPSGMKREILAVLPMIANRGGEYVTVLNNLERGAEIELQKRGFRKL